MFITMSNIYNFALQKEWKNFLCTLDATIMHVVLIAHGISAQFGQTWDGTYLR